MAGQNQRNYNIFNRTIWLLLLVLGFIDKVCGLHGDNTDTPSPTLSATLTPSVTPDLPTSTVSPESSNVNVSDPILFFSRGPSSNNIENLLEFLLVGILSVAASLAASIVGILCHAAFSEDRRNHRRDQESIMMAHRLAPIPPPSDQCTFFNPLAIQSNQADDSSTPSVIITGT